MASDTLCVTKSRINIQSVCLLAAYVDKVAHTFPFSLLIVCWKATQREIDRFLSALMKADDTRTVHFSVGKRNGGIKIAGRKKAGKEPREQTTLASCLSLNE